MRLFLAAATVALCFPSSLSANKPVPVCTPQVPCTDPRGCPNLTLDPGALTVLVYDTRTFAPDSCEVVEGMVAAGTRNLILFATITNNIGPGELYLGNPADHPDWFVYSACHGHYHIKDYADYRLWTPQGYAQWNALRAANPNLCAQQILDANPALASQFVKGNKLGLCFWDVLPVGQAYYSQSACPGTPDPQKYVSCDNAGLSVCWADAYGAVPGQWIDVTGLPDGDYVLENESDATHLITETSYTDNRIAAALRLKNGNVHYVKKL